jgi:predicted SprT family Zn-dependent metalloprotease
MKLELCVEHTKKKKELRGFSPQTNYTNRAIAAGQRS